MELFEELERLKLKFISAYSALCDAGRISEAEFDEVVDLLDELDEHSIQEVTERLTKMGLLQTPVRPAATADKFRQSWKNNQIE